MSEHAPRPEEMPGPRLVEKIAGHAVGAVAGAGAMNEFLPPVIHPAPGFAYEARLSLDPGVSAHWGSIGFHVPHALGSLPVGIDANITELMLKSNGSHNTFKMVEDLGHNLPAIANHTAMAMGEHLVVGGGVGFIIGGYLAAKAGKSLRERGLFERFKSLSIVQKIGALAAGGALLAGCAPAIYEGTIGPDAVPQAPLSASIIKHSGNLDGAYETGVDPEMFASLERDFVYVDNSYVNNSKSSSQTASAIANFQSAYYKAQQSYLWRYSNNPNDIVIQQVSDMHCFYPNFPLEQAELAEIGPDIVVDVGDLGTNGGEAPYEDKCLADQVKTYEHAAIANRALLYVYRVNGNHDAKKTVTVINKNLHMYTLRGKDNVGYADGLTFVGTDDPRNTTFSTTPFGAIATDKALARQSSETAATACKITEETGQAPYVITHGIEGSLEALAKGCAQIAFNGHTHHNGPVNVFQGSDGLTEYQHTAGTVSGVQDGITIYQPQKLPASSTTWYINKTTHRPDAVITENIFPDGHVTIEDEPLTGDSTIQMNNYLQNITPYSATANMPVKVTFDSSGQLCYRPAPGHQNTPPQTGQQQDPSAPAANVVSCR